MIKEHITESLNKALKSLKIDETAAVERPNNMNHGDYTTTIALKLAKILKKNPMEIAHSIAQAVQTDEVISKVEVLKPGFVNFWISYKVLNDNLVQIINNKDHYGKKTPSGKKILLEFGQPNTHKLPHIGHLFSYIFGESLARILIANGNDVTRLNYQGDIGLHVAKCLYKFVNTDKYFTLFKDSNPFGRVKMLQQSYQEGSQLYETNIEIKNKIDQINRDLYLDAKYLNEMYKSTREASIEYFHALERDSLNIRYDKYYYESDTFDTGKSIVKKHVGDIFEKSDDAIIFRGEKYGLHTRVFINKFDNPTYEAKDIGLISIKQKDFPNFDLSIVTTANEQNEYWKVIEKVTELLFPDLKNKIKHIGFGMINLTTGKMSSRTGIILDAPSLIQSVFEEIQRAHDYEADFVNARNVALSAIKYSFLKSEAQQNMTFDVQKSIARSGDSGPYLLYTFVRCNKLSNKPPITFSLPTELSDTEYSLIRLLCQYKEIVENAANNFSPHLIASYIYEVARCFNLLYQNKEYTIQGNDFRLTLTAGVAQIIKNGLNLLGIQTVEKM